MQGAFVRALNAVYHLQCFKCMVSDIAVCRVKNPHSDDRRRTVARLLRPSSSLSTAKTASNTLSVNETTSGA